MSANELPPPPQPIVLTMQIIWFAMLMGVTAFAVIAVFILDGQPVAEPIISYVAVGCGALAIVASNVVPAVVGRQLAAQRLSKVTADDPLEDISRGLATVFQTKLIIGLAILEGAAFFTLVAFQIERQQFALAATVALWFLLLVRIPTPSRVNDWCQRVYENETLNTT